MNGSIRPATVLLGCLFLSLLPVAPALAALGPDQVAVLANSNSQASLAVARHYVERRGLAHDRVIALDVPLDDTIGRDAYVRRVVEPTRRALVDRRLASKVRVLVTTYGVPLRVSAPIPNSEQTRWAKDAERRGETARAGLEAVQGQVQRLAPFEGPGAGGGDEATSPAMSAADPVSEEVSRAIRAAALRVQGVTDRRQRERWTLELARLAVLSGGPAALIGRPGGEESPAAREDAAKKEREIATLRMMIETLVQHPSDRNRPRAYRLMERVFGFQGVVQLAKAEVEAFTYRDGDASLDSELSLLWWDADTDYRVAGRIANPLHHEADGWIPATLPVLMVSRLDASSPQAAMQLVDQALAAEAGGLSGRVYVDARGLSPEPPFGYGYYDQSLRDMAALARRHLPNPVVLEDTDRRFSRPGEAPDAAVYVGWYRLRAYEDAFTFKPGALGYHIASAEAMSLHDPRERGWCKNALDRGISACLGSTGEPYVDAFPLPHEWLGLILTGRYSLVEAYYLTLRHLSWRMVLIGDPLYTPWRAGRRDGVEDAVRRSLRGNHAAMPAAPSDRAFPDPVLVRLDARRWKETRLAETERVVGELEQQFMSATPPSQAGQAGNRPEGRE